jgi:hypothetical protein
VLIVCTVPACCYEPDSVRVLWTGDSGLHWQTLFSGPNPGGEVSWDIPHLISGDYEIRVEDLIDGDVIGVDISDGPFYVGSFSRVTDAADDESQAKMGISITPRPAADRVMISYSLPCDTYVRLCVFDCRGRLVQTLAEGTRQAGSDLLEWRFSDKPESEVSSGIYFIRLQAGDQVATRKVVLIR